MKMKSEKSSGKKSRASLAVKPGTSVRLPAYIAGVPVKAKVYLCIYNYAFSFDSDLAHRLATCVIEQWPGSMDTLHPPMFRTMGGRQLKCECAQQAWCNHFHIKPLDWELQDWVEFRDELEDTFGRDRLQRRLSKRGFTEESPKGVQKDE
jgi:hypothetical protein